MLKMLYGKSLRCFGALTLATLIGCSGDDDGAADLGVQDDVEATEAALSTDLNDLLADGAEECPGLPDLTGKAYVANKIVATQPTKEINPIWAKEVSEYNMVLIFYVKNHDQVNQTITMEVTSASSMKTENEDGTFTPTSFKFGLAPTEFTVPLEGCGCHVPPIELDMQAKSSNKPFHIVGVTGDIAFAPDGKKITDISLNGGIKEDFSYDLCMTSPFGYISFHWFMNLAAICPSWDSDGNGSLDAYRFIGHISAVETDVFDRSEIVAIIPPGGVCKEDKEPCL